MLKCLSHIASLDPASAKMLSYSVLLPYCPFTLLLLVCMPQFIPSCSSALSILLLISENICTVVLWMKMYLGEDVWPSN